MQVEERASLHHGKSIGFGSGAESHQGSSLDKNTFTGRLYSNNCVDSRDEPVSNVLAIMYMVS